MRKEAGRERSISEPVSIRIFKFTDSSMIYMLLYAGQLKEQLLRQIYVPLKILPNKVIVVREGASFVTGFF